MESFWVIFDFNEEPRGGKAVCRQSEWERMQRWQPGRHHLIQTGIRSEAEAEKLIWEQGAASAKNAPKKATVPARPRVNRPWYRGET
jgi:hypothetical protein